MIRRSNSTSTKTTWHFLTFSTFLITKSAIIIPIKNSRNRKNGFEYIELALYIFTATGDKVQKKK